MKRWRYLIAAAVTAGSMAAGAGAGGNTKIKIDAAISAAIPILRLYNCFFIPITPNLKLLQKVSPHYYKTSRVSYCGGTMTRPVAALTTPH